MNDLEKLRIALDGIDTSGINLIQLGFEKLLALYVERKIISADHVAKTPHRYVEALRELMEGVTEDPVKVLGTVFEETEYDEMIVVRDISFVSLCAHHLLPFIGTIDFGYIPNKKVVGLSKIPRLVECLARRPQIQEKLSNQIVEVFQKEIDPLGCGVKITANHMCMGIRGVRKPDALTDTVALRGVFKSNTTTKQEFLDLIRR